LDGALLLLGVSVAGRRCLDAGAATGGFTDCLLRRGASEVVALDVGTGQLDRTLASDPRVRPMEGVNLRHVGPEEVGAPLDLVVADLSFISLCTVAPVLASMTGPSTDLVLLVKPQFEVGRGLVGRTGVVRRPELWRAALERVIRCLEEAGLGAIDICRSPIEGGRGNREFFLLGRSGHSGAIDVAAVVAQ
jgi:23S rRNA (cytidine1920-2'-O)/16S rRNA (cytidine1409-2'-O)-methyltransferase